MNMDGLHLNSRRARERAEDEAILESRFCNVAAAIIGSAAVGAIGSSMSKGPDTSGMNQAAQSEAALSKEQLDWSKQIYADTAPDRAKATQIAFDQADLQTQAARKQLAAADDTLNYQNTTFRPVEQKLASDAMAYDTPARREAAAAAARADTEQELAGQRMASERAMERSGVTPGSGRSMAMQGMMDIGATKLKVGAANTARTQVEQMGTAKLADVANLGRNIASSQVAQVQSGIQAGSAATANGQVPVNVAGAGAGLMQQGFSGAQQSMASSGSLYGSIAGVQNAANANTNATMSGFGSAVGKIAAGRYGVIY